MGNPQSAVTRSNSIISTTAKAAAVGLKDKSHFIRLFFARGHARRNAQGKPFHHSITPKAQPGSSVRSNSKSQQA